MISGLSKILAAVALLVVLTGMPDQAFAHSGYNISDSVQHHAGTDADSFSAVDIATVFETLAGDEGSCSKFDCSCCGCACHGHALLFSWQSHLDPHASSTTIPVSLTLHRQRVPSSAEQPPKSFA